MFLKSCLFVTLLIVATSHCTRIAEIRHIESTWDRAALKECRNYGGEEAVQSYKAAHNDFSQCLNEILTGKEDINLYIPNEAIDAYCGEIPTMKECVHPFLDAAMKCSKPSAKVNSTMLRTGIDAVFDFTCKKEDNEYLIIKYLSKGIRCYAEKASEILECVSSLTTSQQLSEDITEEEACELVENIEKCLLRQLKSCRDPEFGQYIESYLKIANVITCPSIKFDADV